MFLCVTICKDESIHTLFYYIKNNFLPLQECIMEADAVCESLERMVSTIESVVIEAKGYISDGNYCYYIYYSLLIAV